MSEGVDFYGPVKASNKEFCLATLENLTKEFPEESHIVMRITPRVPGGIPPRAMVYKYNSRKFLGFIATEGAGSTESGDPYLSRFPDMYYNVSIRPIDCTNLIGIYLNACNGIDSQNRMRQSD